LSALRHYERCRTALNRELGVEPDEDTVVLYEQIRANKSMNLSMPPTQRDQAHQEPLTRLPEILAHLKRFQRILSVVQKQIQQDIQVVDQALDGPHRHPSQNS
jgi:DNA-binding SARP family transcriptional activator